jgi:hypothetical protein
MILFALPEHHARRGIQGATRYLSYLKNRVVNHPRFSISILAPSMKFSGPCSMRTTQQNVVIAKNISQSTKRKYRTRRYYPSAVSLQETQDPAKTGSRTLSAKR